MGQYFMPHEPRFDVHAAMFHDGWLLVVWLLAYGWVYSYFWSAAAQIYLLLRQDVDGTPWDDIHLPERDAAVIPAASS